MNYYIPIGSNCSVSHFLRKYNLRQTAYPFDWNCASLEMVYNVIINDFTGFLDNIFIGNKINRLYFGDGDELIVTNETIFPIICKKYNILFPHDFNNINPTYINEVKNKYKRRIERFRNIINNNTTENVFLVYCNENFELNKWQESVYNEYKIDLLKDYKNNDKYLNKIKRLFRDKNNINIISLNELKKRLKL